MTTHTLPASEQIKQLEDQIQQLKHQALAELKEKLAAARAAVADLEGQLAELTGKPVASVSAAPARKTVRRPSIADADLKPFIIKAVSDHGKNGLNAKDIASLVDQDPMRVRRFIAANPALLKRQGSGPGTRFFLP